MDKFLHASVPGVLSTLIGGLVLSSGALGHDEIGAARQVKTGAAAQIRAALAATRTSDVETRSVLSNLLTWSSPRSLTICFVGGTAVLRKRVATAMQSMWPLAQLTGGRVDFDVKTYMSVSDCDPSKLADIRVGFEEGSGHWSYVGVESLSHPISMNFDGFTETSPSDIEFRRIVGHETGHMLGLQHEHQSPALPGDCGWDFDYIWKNYKWNTVSEMKYNFERLSDELKGEQHSYIFSTYDKRSLMHYVFKPVAFLQGTKSPCFVGKENNEPSDLDRAAVRFAYGREGDKQRSLTRGAIPKLLQRFSGAEYQDLRKLLEAQ